MFTRRESLVGGALTIFFGDCLCAHSQSSRAPNSRGCLLADADFDAIYPNGTDTRQFISGDEPMIPRSGDHYFDIALAHTLAKLASTFDVLPGFAYYDDFKSSNAYATRRTRLNRADGTVLMGINLLRRLRGGLESPEVAVAAVCAHEFGHILQFRHRLFERVEAGRKTGKRGELQADYLAGYFAGLRKRERPNYPAAVFAMTQFSVGDYEIHSEQHHGTPKERGEAVVRGFEASFRDNKTLSEAIEESSAYVLGIFSH